MFQDFVLTINLLRYCYPADYSDCAAEDASKSRRTVRATKARWARADSRTTNCCILGSNCLIQNVVRARFPVFGGAFYAGNSFHFLNAFFVLPLTKRTWYGVGESFAKTIVILVFYKPYTQRFQLWRCQQHSLQLLLNMYEKRWICKARFGYTNGR